MPPDTKSVLAVALFKAPFSAFHARLASPSTLGTIVPTSSWEISWHSRRSEKCRYARCSATSAFRRAGLRCSGPMGRRVQDRVDLDVQSSSHHDVDESTSVCQQVRDQKSSATCHDTIMAMIDSDDSPTHRGTARSRQPAQGSGYSALTAWVMAIMSELAYMRFEEEDLTSLLALPAELGQAFGRCSSASETQALERQLATRDNRNSRLLRAVLSAGGFELVGTLSDSGTDTQGFVAVRRAGDETDMTVVSFRGTENVRDWGTNLRHALTPAEFLPPVSNESPGKVHQGFLDAFMSVKEQVDRHMQCASGVPIFITGHSLGGALATLATAHLSGWGLTACYTFGAPRVGDKGFASNLRAPVYRVVNPLDTVPLVPPWSQGYRHAGVRKKLRCTSPLETLRQLLGGSVRLWRAALGQELSLYRIYDTVDRSHNIRVYREKLHDDASGPT